MASDYIGLYGNVISFYCFVSYTHYTDLKAVLGEKATRARQNIGIRAGHKRIARHWQVWTLANGRVIYWQGQDNTCIHVAYLTREGQDRGKGWQNVGRGRTRYWQGEVKPLARRWRDIGKETLYWQWKGRTLAKCRTGY